MDGLFLYIKLLIESLTTSDNLSNGCRNSDVNIIISSSSWGPFWWGYYLQQAFILDYQLLKSYKEASLYSLIRRFQKLNKPSQHQPYELHTIPCIQHILRNSWTLPWLVWTPWFWVCYYRHSRTPFSFLKCLHKKENFTINCWSLDSKGCSFD